MDYCLSCDEPLLMQITWQNVIHPTKRAKLCALCTDQLEELSGKQCKTCSRQTTVDQCEDCKRWASMFAGKDPLQRNTSVYAYNESIKEMITKWKYRGDYVLGEAFQEAFIKRFNESFSDVIKQAIIVPIPLSADRLYERGFNQAQMLTSFLQGNSEQLLKRIHNEKQAKKSRIERLMTENPFRVTERVNRQVILIDDIYTTGRTVRHAAQALKENGCPQVFSYTLIRG